MHIDGQFDGTVPVRLDPSKIIVLTTFGTRFLGKIPYLITITQ